MQRPLAFSLTLLLSFLALLPMSAGAQEIPKRPEPPRLVNDLAGLLSSQQKQQLERKLVAYSDSTSSQIAIVTINSLEGRDVSRYAVELGHKWGVGQEGKDNGIVILVAKKERKAYIATGYGVEGMIPDLMAKKLIDQFMVPNFKKGNFYAGLNQTTDAIFQLLQGEFKGMPKEANENKTISIGVIVVIGLIIFLFVIFSKVTAVKRMHRESGHDVNLWTALFLTGMFSSFGGHHSSHGSFWNDFQGGGGDFGGGGFGGGDFGGFGGGDFGGGGAGGDW